MSNQQQPNYGGGADPRLGGGASIPPQTPSNEFDSAAASNAGGAGSAG